MVWLGGWDWNIHEMNIVVLYWNKNLNEKKKNGIQREVVTKKKKK